MLAGPVKEAFFAPHDMSQGILVNLQNSNFMFFSDLSILVADEVALKQSLENKGSAGKLFCCRCSNVISKSSYNNIVNESPGLVPSTETDWDKFKIHSNETVMAIIKHLQEQEEVLPAQQFSKLETALGFNFRPGGLLTHPRFGHIMPCAVMFDWMHIYMVHGICGTQLGILCGELKDAGINESRLENFLGSFQWPKQFQGSRPQNLFSKRGHKYEALKGSASERLSAYNVIRVFIVLFVGNQLPELRKATICFFKLCEVLDLLVSINRGMVVEPALLKAAVKAHLDSFLDHYSSEYWVPKCHMALHLHEFLSRHKTLISCFTHERKHRLVKRFGNNMMSCNHAFERSILSDVIHVQLQNLQDVRCFQNSPYLVGAKGAPKEMVRTIQHLLGNQCEVLTSLVAQCQFFQVSKHDVVEVELSEGNLAVGQVLYHCTSGQLSLSCLSLWEFVSGFMYRVKDVPILVETRQIRKVCVFSLKGDSACVVFQ